MTKLYITRHGETEWNKLGKMQGWNDSPLTELGKVQAQWLRDRVENINFSKIYTSSSDRAYKTAEIIKGDRDIEIVPSLDLREIRLGVWQGLTQEEISELNKENHYNYWNKPEKYITVEGAESFEEVRDRAYRTIMKMVRENKGKEILVVTHTTVLKGFMCALQKKEIKDLWEPPFIKQTSLTVVEFDEDENYKIITNADASHHQYTFKEYNQF
ncbi:histidine phosphatase family protein [Clostridium senegalense]|uniref:histidine phosphatase family protein n=1 Tax=Clostridium senegalense TaxID=1465809 RepID=UPI000289CFA7|nr:histidine phosphatase family protein [Clostridium senegalense]